MLRPVAAAALAFGLAATTQASSPDAWAAYETKLTDACLKDSGFKDAKAESSLLAFGDDVGRDALIVAGVWPQPHMKGAQGRMLCLFDKTTQKATTVEIMPAPKAAKQKR